MTNHFESRKQNLNQTLDMLMPENEIGQNGQSQTNSRKKVAEANYIFGYISRSRLSRDQVF